MKKDRESEAIRTEKNNILSVQYKLLILKYLLIEKESSTLIIGDYLKSLMPNYNSSLFFVCATILKIDKYIELIKNDKTFYKATSKGLLYYETLSTYYLESHEQFKKINILLNERA